MCVQTQLQLARLSESTAIAEERLHGIRTVCGCRFFCVWCSVALAVAMADVAVTVDVDLDLGVGVGMGIYVIFSVCCFMTSPLFPWLQWLL